MTLSKRQLQQVTTLDHLLRDPVLLEKFKQFAMREHSADLLFFWMEVEEYHKKKKRKRKRRAKKWWGGSMGIMLGEII
jgi:hypothetical protein